MISTLEKEYLFIKMERDIKDKWELGKRMEKVFFTIQMEEFSKVRGNRMKSVDMAVKKDRISMKDNGNLD